MPFFKKSKSGTGYVILNVIRVCNIVCLLSVLAASFVMLVKTFMVSKFFLFDGISHLVTAFISIGLIITELPLFRRYVAANWPLLSPSSGFVTLGIIMIVLGDFILGNLNKDATSEDSLGTSMWRCVIASGILTLIFGVVNIFASYMFRRKALGITARQVRMHGSTAPQKTTPYVSPAPSTHPSTNTRRGRNSFFGLRRANTEVLPSYHSNPTQTTFQQPIRNISAPISSGAGPNGLGMAWANTNHTGSSGAGISEKDFAHNNGGYDASGGREGGVHIPPVVAGVQRPDLAHHPAYQVRRPASSVYSQATNGLPLSRGRG